MTSSYTSLHIRKYAFNCFSWMLFSITMELSEVTFMSNISNIFLAQFWSLEINSRSFHDFPKMLILGCCSFLVVDGHLNRWSEHLQKNQKLKTHCNRFFSNFNRMERLGTRSSVLRIKLRKSWKCSS